MKLKYRILEYQFPKVESVYIAQYKVLGIWMNINKDQLGRFLTPTSTYCESPLEAAERLELHKKNMKRATWWWDKSKHIIY